MNREHRLHVRLGHFHTLYCYLCPRSENPVDILKPKREGAQGGHVSTTLRCSLSLRSASEVKFLEDEEERLNVTANSLRLEFRPFQIRSVNLTLR